MSELLIGCGSNHQKHICVSSQKDWTDLTTLDFNPDHHTDVIHDLNILPYPFNENQFDEIHAYDVLEHTGAQGDWKFFFAQWNEFHRILKPGGIFCGIVPHYQSPWALGDPSHTRVVMIEQLGFLSQKMYEDVGKTAISDFRFVWKGDFELVHAQVTKDQRQVFVLKKVGK